MKLNARFGGGLLLLGAGLLLALNLMNRAIRPITYATIASPQPITQLASLKHQARPGVLVLYRPSCPACQRAEHVIVTGVQRLRYQRQAVVVVNLAALSPTATTQLITALPALTRGGQLPTPQVVWLKPTAAGNWQVTAQSSQTHLDLAQLQRLLAR